MGRMAVLFVLILGQPAPAQVELKWKWKPDQTFWAQTTTLVVQSFVLEDQPAIKVPPDFKAADVDRQALEQLIRITRAEPVVRSVLSRRVGAAFAVGLPGGPLAGAGLLTPYRLAWEREIRQRYEYTTFIRYTVRKRNDDGSAVIVQRVEKGRTVIKPAPRTDKPEDRPDTGLDDVELTLHVDPRGVVTKVEGAGEALLTKLAVNDTDRRKALEEILSAETIQAGISPANVPGRTSNAISARRNSTVVPRLISLRFL